MNKTKIICLITSLLLGLTIIAVPLNGVAMAATSDLENLSGALSEQSSLPEDEEEIIEEVKYVETFEIGAKYPVLTGASDTSFMFEVDFTRAGGNENLDFDLTITGPQDWLVYAAQDQYNSDKRISAMRINQL